jgi:hypothetical protein
LCGNRFWLIGGEVFIEDYSDRPVEVQADYR